ncbi:MAG: hypothetical protein OXE95_11000 [Chloroflexi bacterium]|nr:hypothetical protein [Chloroflexota bacterium]MCY4248085.1 hypothetical protein [Chloroflexota bacterium]
MDQELLDQAKALAARNYQIVVEREEAPEGKATWVAYMPELPACVAEGDSPLSARNALIVLSEDYIYFRLKRGVPVPAPQQNRHSPAQQKPALRQFN